MSAGAGADVIAGRITDAILAIDGVRSIFPKRPAPAVIVTLVGAGHPAAAPLVDVEVRGQDLLVAARLATSRTTPIRVIIDRVLTAVQEVVDGGAPRIDIELAYIE